MRSGVGAACPLTRLLLRVELLRVLLDFFVVRVVVFAVVVPVVGFWDVLRALLVCAAKAAGSVKLPTAIAARIKRVIRRLFCSVRIAGRMCWSIVSSLPEPRPEGTWS